MNRTSRSCNCIGTADELTKRASPEFMRAVSSDELAKFAVGFHRKSQGLEQWRI